MISPLELKKNFARESYIEVIYELCKTKGYASITDISRKLGVAPASASEMVRKLAEMKLVNCSKRKIVLTKKGNEFAKELNERHNLLKKLFIKIGISEDLAEKEACKLEHCIDPRVFEAIKKFVND